MCGSALPPVVCRRAYKRCAVILYLQLFVGERMSYLRVVYK